MFWWIPSLAPLLGVFIILVSPFWPISEGQGASGNERFENWKKFGVYFGVNLLGCVLIAVGMWGGAVAKSYFPEVWNYQIVGIKHEMEWTERESRTRQVACGTDKDGRTTYRTETYYVTEHYGPYWRACDEYGDWNGISEETYNQWKKLWGNEKQTGMHKGSSAGWDRSIDGPIYECKWPRTFDTIFPWTAIHRYQNKIRVSDSIFRFGEPTEEMLKKYPRPADKRNSNPVINYGGRDVAGNDLMCLRRVNASLGRREQIHTILVMLGTENPRGQVEDILKAWGGPNKNELVTFIAIQGGNVVFCDVHSWMDDTTLHGMLRNDLVAGEWSPKRYADLLMEHVPKYWKRKEFTPINEYLRVPIHPGWMIAGIILAIVLSIGSFLVIENMFESGTLLGRYQRPAHRYGQFRGFRRKSRW